MHNANQKLGKERCRFRTYQVFQGKLKGAGVSIAMHKEVAVRVIISADYQVVMFSEICKVSGEENGVGCF